MAIKTRKIKLGIVVGWNPVWPDPRGVRVTEANYVELAKWVGGLTLPIVKKNPKTKDLTEHRIKIFTDRGNRVRVARVGDVVVKQGDGKYTVIKKKDFLGFEK